MSVAAPARSAAPPDRRDLTTRIQVIAHGSPDPRHRASVSRLGGRLATLTGHDVQVCYLEHDQPRAAVVLAEPIGPGTETMVIPLLLTAGFHWRCDIPPVVAHLGSRAVLLPPPEPVLFGGAVERLVGATGHVVLASAGSSRPEIVSRFARVADALGTHDRSVDVCLTVDSIAATAGPGSIVVPFLTAGGLFADRIRRAAVAAGASVTPVLGDTDGFAETLADLVAPALP